MSKYTVEIKWGFRKFRLRDIPAYYDHVAVLKAIASWQLHMNMGDLLPGKFTIKMRRQK